MNLNEHRDVLLSPERPYSFGDYQCNYLNYRTRRLFPSTRIHFEGKVIYRTNALGCLGEEVQPAVPVIAVFGDSAVHGFQAHSFVEQIRIDGHQTLNAGIEGLTLPWIVDRFLELRDALRGQAPLACVAVHSGWHNIVYNDPDEAFWAAELDRVQGVALIAHFRLVGDVNAEAVTRGYEEVFAASADYGPWAGFDHALRDERQRFMDCIARFNRFIEAYCAERGRLLIDLEPAIAPRAYADLGRSFLDFIHPSPQAYGAMARTIEAALAPQLQTASGGNP